jgi:hypothetical protein
MSVVTFPDGMVMNLETGEILGAEPKATTAADVLKKKSTVDVERPAGEGGGFMDALNQFSWGFNSALFSLPDAVVKQVGRAAGVKEEEIPQMVEYFNRGEVAPEGQLERFTRAIGKGSGSALPFTGLLGAFARTNALTAPLAPSAGVLKRTAKDMLDFIRTNPKAAVATDLGFGGVFGAIEQAGEEFIEEGPYKQAVVSSLPVASALVFPTVANVVTKVAQYSPTYQAAKALLGSNPGAVLEKDALADGTITKMIADKAPNIPGLRWGINRVNRGFETKAIAKVQEIMKPLSDPQLTDVQAAMKVTKDLQDFVANDPRLKSLGLSDRFLLDAAQSALHAPLITARNQVLKELYGDPLKREALRQQDLEKVFLSAFEAIAPRSKMDLSEALKITQADYKNAIAKSLQEIKTITDEEALIIADRFAPQDLGDLGDSLRRSVLAQMEGSFQSLRKEATDLGARAATAEGVPTAVRSDGKPLDYIPSTAFENFARGMVSKYKLTPSERIFMGDGAPAPVQYISSMLTRLDRQKQKIIGQEVENLVAENLTSNLPAAYRALVQTRPEDAAAVIGQQTQDIAQYVLGKKSMLSLQKQYGKDFRVPSQDDIKSILATANKKAEDAVDFRITFPEAVDMLSASMRYRNVAMLEYNKRMSLGMNRERAQRLLDTANALHRDVEGFVTSQFKNSPEFDAWLQKYDDVYRKGYEKAFPLLITKRRGTDEFSIDDEQVVKEALSSANNVRLLNTIMGQDNSLYNKMIGDAIFDKAYRANVFDKDGLLDPAKYNRWMAQNKNIINALPQKVQQELSDYTEVGRRALERIRDAQERAEAVQDVEFEQMVRKFVRPDADPTQLAKNALTDPATMRKLVTSLENKPGQVKALRRAVWDTVKKDMFNPDNPAFLENYIKQHEKSLRILYPQAKMEDLKLLAEMQKRVFAGDAVEGKLSPFMSFDEKLRKTIGSGVGTVESTARAATIRQINPMHAGVSLMTRLITRQQNNVYEAMMYKALTDPDYAKAMINSNANANTPQGVKQMSALASKAGFYLPALTRVAAIEGVSAVDEARDREIPIRSPLPMNQGPRITGQPSPAPTVPAANQPLSQSAPARTLPQMPSPQQMDSSAYPMLFPNDFLSPMLEQRNRTAQP